MGYVLDFHSLFRPVLTSIHSQLCYHVATALYTILAYRLYGYMDETPSQLKIAGVEKLTARNKAQCGFPASFQEWKLAAFKDWCAMNGERKLLDATIEFVEYKPKESET